MQKFIIIEKKSNNNNNWKLAKFHQIVNNIEEAKEILKVIIKKYMKSGYFKFYDMGEFYFELYNLDSQQKIFNRRIEIKNYSETLKLINNNQ